MNYNDKEYLEQLLLGDNTPEPEWPETPHGEQDNGYPVYQPEIPELTNWLPF